MKKLKRFLCMALPIAAMLFASCSKGNDEAAFIPKDAVFVVNVDMGSIWEKGDISNASSLTSVRSMINTLKAGDARTGEWCDRLLADPSSCGIDLSKDVVFFGGANNDDFSYVVTARMKDAEAMKSTLALCEIPMEQDSYKGLQRVVMNDECVMLYNDKRMIMVCGDCEIEEMSAYGAQLFKLGKKESMRSDKHFAEYWGHRADVSLYANYGALMSGYEKLFDENLLFSLSEEDREAIAKASMYVALSFEKGTIDLRMVALGMPEHMTKISNAKFNKDLMACLPENTWAAFTGAFDVEALAEYMNQNAQTKALMAMPIGIESYKGIDILKALGGSMAGSFYGCNDAKQPLFVAAIDTKDDALIRALLNFAGLEGENNIYPVGDMFAIYYTDGLFVFTSDRDALQKIVAGGFENSMQRIAAKAEKGNYMFIDLDMANYSENFFEMLGIGMEERVTYALFAGLFDYIDLQGEGNESLIQIHLKEAKDNSLAALLNNYDAMLGAFLAAGADVVVETAEETVEVAD